jgi:ureidoglycolate lyase
MTTIHRIRAEPLTAARFAPFGRLIAARDGPPDYRGGSGTLGWHVPFESGRPLLSVLRTPHVGLSFAKMERHLHVSQAFVPLGGAPAVVAVAPPSDPLRLADVRAFLLDGAAGYVLHRGTWHSLDRFPLRPPHTDFLMITDHETQDDLTESYAGRGTWTLTQEVDLVAAFGLAIEILADAPS